MVRPFLRTGLWAGNTPLGSPDLPFIRFCAPIVDEEVVGAALVPKREISEGHFGAG